MKEANLATGFLRVGAFVAAQVEPIERLSITEVQIWLFPAVKNIVTGETSQAIIS